MRMAIGLILAAALIAPIGAQTARERAVAIDRVPLPARRSIRNRADWPAARCPLVAGRSFPIDGTS